MKPLLLLFDIDGTLLHTGGAGTRALNRVFQSRYSVSGAMDGIVVGGMTDPLILDDIFYEKLGRTGSASEYDAIFRAYRQLLAEEIAGSERFVVFPDVHECLERLSSREEFLLTVATGNIQAAAEIKLRFAKLDHFFQEGGFGDDHKQRDKLVRQAAVRRAELSRLAVTDCRTIVVGDTPRDVHAARANKFEVAIVTTGSFSREQIDNERPDFVGSSLSEVVEWIGV